MTSNIQEENDACPLNLRESFFHDDFHTVDQFFNNVDDRVNQKIAIGMKKAIKLIVGKFD